MVVTDEEEALQKSTFEVTWTDEESGVAKKAKKVRVLDDTQNECAVCNPRRGIWRSWHCHSATDGVQYGNLHHAKQ